MIAAPDLVVVCVIFKAQTTSSRRGPMLFIDIDFPVLWGTRLSELDDAA